MQLKGRSLLIRADANTRIGIGHLMRCLALAQAWKDSGGEVAFITACENAGLLQRLSDEGFEATQLDDPYPDRADWEATSRVLAAHPNAWVALDGYHFDPAYQRRIKKAGHALLVIDDMAHLEHYYADIVLNQNLHAEYLDYSCEPYSQLLLGSQYVLLRREFLKWRGWKRETPEVARKVLVTLGGGDPDNATLNAIRAMNKLELGGLEARVVIGPSNPHLALLKECVHDSRFTIHLLPSVEDMPELMAWADVAVSAAGSTCWELAFMGLPSLLLALAKNQRSVAEQISATGAALDLGWHEDLTPDTIAQSMTGLLTDLQKRLQMVRHSQELIDGEGSDRFLMRLESGRLRLRLVQEEDCRLLWGWANDPDVRAASFSSEPIPWERHAQWFRSKFADPHSLIYIVMNGNGTLVGQVRYEINGKEAVISISLDREFRHKGYGMAIIRLASHELLNSSNVDVIHAYTKPDNEASAQAFIGAGFRNAGITTTRGEQALRLILERRD